MGFCSSSGLVPWEGRVCPDVAIYLLLSVGWGATWREDL